MKTLQQELEEIKREAEEKVRAANIKHEVLAKLPNTDGYAQPYVHNTKIYGAKKWVRYSQQLYSSIATGKSPDAALVKTLMENLPPEDLLLLKSACTSFCHEDAWEPKHGVTATEIAPYFIRIETTPGIAMDKLNWITMLDGQPTLIEVEMPRMKWFQLWPLYSGNGRAGDPGARIVGWDRKVRQDIPTTTPDIIRWASDRVQHPPCFTLYWSRYVDVNPEMLWE